MLHCWNPFKKHDVRDFEGVYQPLSHAKRHPSVLAVYEARRVSVEADSTMDSASEIETRRKSGGSGSSSNVLRGADSGAPDTDSSRLGQYSPLTIEGLQWEVENDIVASGHDSVYDRKSHVINKAMQDIDMGPYQWQLFFLCGFGWLADNLWLQGVALTLPQLSLEFGISPSHVRYTTCATFLGLCLGAACWGFAADMLGRRVAFNFTLFLAGAAGLAVGSASSWTAVCALYAAVGVGVGGSLPVDGALFLEFLPAASGSMLTLLSVWWPLGQLAASGIASGFITRYTCDPTGQLPSCVAAAAAAAAAVQAPPPCCAREDNMGWRYANFAFGALTCLMFVARFFCFHLFESPKYLLACGRQAEAVATVHGVASRNSRNTWLTEDILDRIGRTAAGAAEEAELAARAEEAERNKRASTAKLSAGEVLRRFVGRFSARRVSELFAERRLGVMTALMWFCWAAIGMGYPLFNAFLPQYLADAGAGQPPTPVGEQYRNYLILSGAGFPGTLLAARSVDLRRIGRKGTVTGATLITGFLLIGFTASKNPRFQTVVGALEAFFQNVMYGVLYAYTPEVFPAPNRGTATGIASCLNRLTGLFAPIVAVYVGGVSPNAPIYAAGALFLVAAGAMSCFPTETRGRQSL